MKQDLLPLRSVEPVARGRRFGFTNRRVVPVIGIALVLLVAGMSLRGPGPSGSGERAPTSSSTGNPPQDALSIFIANAQQRLSDNPQDWQAWAALGSSYVEQARATADPSYYSKAEGALKRSFSVRPEDNPDAEVGLGALANARHEFSAAADHATRALALNPFSSAAFGVLADARTQLGEYAAATEAVQKMLDLGPGVASFTRASYELEIHGNIEGAKEVMQRALEEASLPADVAFCHFYLGELAFNSGNLAEARSHYDAALEADATSAPALAGRAKALFAAGDAKAAIRDYTRVVKRVPLPGYVIELGELYEANGDPEAAGRQYRLAETEFALFAGSGATDSLVLAQFEAEHGDPIKALAHASSEWARRQNADVADALAWALHLNGRNVEALVLAEKAAEPGGRNALFLFHRGMIQKALGQTEQARQDLAAALQLNPHFSVLQAPRAHAALAELGGSR